MKIRDVRTVQNAQENPGVQSQLNMVLNHLEKEIILERDEVEAIYSCRLSAEKGNPAAQDNLECCYWRGVAIEKDEEEAVKWFRRAADQGFAPSQNILGYAYFIRFCKDFC